MDEGNTPMDPSVLNDLEDDASDDDDLPPFRFPSVDGNDEYSDFVPNLESPSPSLEVNPLQEAHPASKTLRWLFGSEFLLMIPLLPLELILPDDWSIALIFFYSVLLLAHILVAFSMFGLLYDPWHNNIVKALKIYQGALGVFSLLFLILFASMVCVDLFSNDDPETLPNQLSSTLGQSGRSLPYHIGSAVMWTVLLLVCTWSFCTLRKHKFDIMTGTGCCPVIRCRACRITCFMGLPDVAIGTRHHQHHLGDSEAISINTLRKRELSASKPRTLPLPGEDDPLGHANFDKRGSVDYFAPIWKTHSSISVPSRPSSDRASADLDSPRLSGSAPLGLGALLAPKRKEGSLSAGLLSRSVGNMPLPHGQNQLLSPLLDHKDSF